MIRHLRVCLLALLPIAAWAQGTKEDYQRARALPERTAGTVFRDQVKAAWLPGNESFWYRNLLPGKQREFILVHAATGERRPAFDHARLSAALARETGRADAAARLELESFEPGESRIRFVFGGRRYEYDETLGELTAAAAAAEGLRNLAEPRPSRDGGPETTLTFVNRTTGDARCFWIGADGQQRAYATVKPGESYEQHTFAGHVWMVKGPDDQVLGVFEAEAGGGSAILDPRIERSRPAPEPRSRNRASSSAEWQAFLRDHNVFVKHRETGEEVQLSRDGTAEHPYTQPFHWSPDGRKLVAQQVKEVATRQIQLIESSPKDQLQPRLHTLDYAKPGDEIRQPKPRLFDIAERSAIPVDDALFPNPWSINEGRWTSDSSEFRFLYNERGHQILRWLALDAATGKPRVIVDERSDTFIDYSQKSFLHPLDATGELLWMSERDGWNHLWLYDAAAGQVKNQITRGEWLVRRVERVDEERRQIWLAIAGQRAGEDPYHLHLARVNFDGTGFVVLTEGDGTHRWEFSPDRRYFLDTWSRIDQPPVTELRRAEDGGLVCVLEQADASALLATGWRPAERFVAKGRDGQTDIYGIITRPINFDPAAKYPVIENIYAGPHGAFVPKEWSREMRNHALAELGFIVVQIDGMGTNWRSRAFHDVAWRNLADGGFPDRIAWLRAAAQKYPELDLTRVGIFGGSAGGQNALAALLHHGDFYRAAAADCGCHDNRMDKVWWNEAWMGWPIGPHYAENSNVTHAHQLQGKLLLTVGELDRNVDPASTMQVVDALIKADKDFELLVVPGAGHGVGESPYAARRRMDFFVRHLLGVEPRQDISLTTHQAASK